jgi:hypothetical protein
MRNPDIAEAHVVAPSGLRHAELLAKLERDLERTYAVHMELRDVPMTVREYVMAFQALLELGK